ncbi:MAG: hypothetical protein J7L34_03405 [Thermotogaceae bacterium]|nr:hypothetical protein [Thermotogaceae bacterium]
MLGGGGGVIAGYLPAIPSPLDQSIAAKNIFLFGGYGTGGEGFSIGGIGFGGESEFEVSSTKYVYNIGAGGLLLEYGKNLGSFLKANLGVTVGGMEEELLRWKDGENTAESFMNGTSEGYTFVERASFFTLPMIGTVLKLNFVNIPIYGAYLLAYSHEGWRFDEGKLVDADGNKFLGQWMIFGGVIF